MSHKLFTQDYRPSTFNDVVGQRLAVDYLKSVIKNPDVAPKSVIFQGAMGSGKTTLARIFAKALNCLGSNPPCGHCKSCKQDINFSSYCEEYDSSDVGNKDTINKIKQSFAYIPSGIKYKVVIFDEIHLASKEAQSALLKTIEDSKSNTFFVFCTTEYDMILDTLKSRCIPLSFNCVSIEDIKTNLRRICSGESISLDDDTLHRIALNSRGYVRNSVMLLNTYYTVEDKDTFKDYIKSSELAIIKLLVLIKKPLPDIPISDIISEICSAPLSTLQDEFETVILNVSKAVLGLAIDGFYKTLYKELSELYKNDMIELSQFILAEWASNVFKSDVTAQIFFYCLCSRFSKQGKSATALSNMDIFKKK